MSIPPVVNKILIAFGGVVVLAALVFIIYSQQKIKSQQEALNNQMVAQQQLVDGIVRSSNQYTTKDDLAQFAKDNQINLKAIQDNLDKLNGQITAINVATSVSQEQHGVNLPSTGVGTMNPNPPVTTCKDGTPCPNADPYGYMKQQQQLALNEKFGNTDVPIGSVGFNAWQPSPWSYDIKKRQYKVDTVVGTDENQRQYFYNKFTVNVDGKDYDVPITTATTKQVEPSAKWSWWNPMVFITAGGAVNTSGSPAWGDFDVGATFGFMSWGKYKTTPTLSVMQVGLGADVVDKQPAVIINPINFNLGTVIPFIHNTYIGPSVQMTFPKFHVMVGGNISLAL